MILFRQSNFEEKNMEKTLDLLANVFFVVTSQYTNAFSKRSVFSPKKRIESEAERPI